MSRRRSTARSSTFKTTLVDWMQQGVIRNAGTILPSVEARKISETGPCVYPPVHSNASASAHPWRLFAKASDGLCGGTVSANAVVTPSLNGISWPDGPGIPSQRQVDAETNDVVKGKMVAVVLDAMEVKYPFAGKGEEDKNVLSPSTQVDLAIQSAGTMSLPNTSNKALVIGSRVQFRLPVPERYASLSVPGHPNLMRPDRGVAGIASYQIYYPGANEAYQPGHELVEASEASKLDASESASTPYVDGVLGGFLRVAVPLMRAGIIKWGTANIGGAGAADTLLRGATFGDALGVTGGQLEGAFEGAAATGSSTGTDTNIAGLFALCGIQGVPSPEALKRRRAVAKLAMDSSKGHIIGGDTGFAGEAERGMARRFLQQASGKAAGGYARSTNPEGRTSAIVMEASSKCESVLLHVQ